MNDNRMEQMVLECLEYVNKTYNLNIKISKIEKDLKCDNGACTCVEKYNNYGVPYFRFKYGYDFYNITKNYNYYKGLMFQYNLATGLNMKSENEYYVFTILHEVGHMYRIYTNKCDNNKYMRQNHRLDKWINKQQIKNKRNTAYIEYHANTKYRRITEEKEADLFAKNNLYGCMKYLKKKGDI